MGCQSTPNPDPPQTITGICLEAAFHWANIWKEKNLSATEKTAFLDSLPKSFREWLITSSLLIIGKGLKDAISLIGNFQRAIE